jgi:uncharacterized protein YbcI
MDLEQTLPTKGQLERQLSQTIQSLYRVQFGQLPSKIACHLFADKVAIVAEDTVTTIERLLLDSAKTELAGSIRAAINKAFTVQVKDRIQEILQVGVIDIICDSTVDSGYLGIVVFLENVPEVRLAKKERYQHKFVAKKPKLNGKQQIDFELSDDGLV